MAEKVIKMSDLINDCFKEFWRESKARNYLKYVLKGGRASGKSVVIGFRVLMDIMRLPVSALVIRKVKDTLHDSVFEQLKECAEILGVSSYFKFNESPLRITYLPRGNKIVFRGADDPAKIKSLKIANFPVAILWIEELAEFKTEDEIITIEQSVLRAELPDGMQYSFYYSYNPPKRKHSWVNSKFNTQFLPDNTYVCHSTYLDNPYTSKAMLEEAEELKKKDEYKYRWVFLGEPIGSGVVPFQNLEFRTITDEEYNTFDNIRQGNDWGYATDPVAFVRWHYDKTRRRIYAMDEFYGVQKYNRELAEWVKKKGYQTNRTVADSAEPKSIAELKEFGCNFTGAKKGEGSVEYGEKWLDDLDAIIIDPKRTPNIAREFENIDYKTDKDGEPMARLEDKDNHTIDATRYAFEDDMRNRKLKVGNKSKLGMR